MKIVLHKTTTKTLVLFLAWMCFSLLTGPTIVGAAVLTHRYSFDTDASDLVGSANGVLQGNALIVNGTAVLDGSNGYVRLPNDLFTNYNSVSLEVWFADGNITSSNAQIYTFSGPGGGMIYKLYGQAMSVSNGVVQVVNLASPAVGGTNHLVWTQNDATRTCALYVNGILAGQNTNFTFTPAGIGSTTNDCLGGSGKVTIVSNFNGGILEFRIYQGALTPLEVAVLDASGPDQPQMNPGTLQAMRVVVPSPTGPGALIRASVMADFSNLTNVNISTQPDLVLTSDNTNVIAIAPDGRLRTMALGMANISATWQGFSNTLAVIVSVPQDIALVHRYGFNEKTNDWIVHDSVGGASGRLFNPLGAGGISTGVFTGNGEMKLAGYPAANAGYVALPGGLLSSLSEVSIETWLTWTPGNVALGYGTGGWQRIFDFGSQANGGGASYLFLTPATDNVSFTTKSLLHAAITSNLNVNETPRLNWTNIFPTNVLSFVAITYSPARKVMKMYLNGVPVASGTATIPLSGIVDTNCWLGRSQFINDPYLNGRYNEFRIYSGLLSDSDIAADYAAGPDTVGVDYVLHNFSASNALTITWGLSVTNLILKKSPSLTGADWSPVANTPSLLNGRYSVTVPLTDAAAFFRLQAP